VSITKIASDSNSFDFCRFSDQIKNEAEKAYEPSLKAVKIRISFCLLQPLINPTFIAWPAWRFQTGWFLSLTQKVIMPVRSLFPVVKLHRLLRQPVFQAGE